MYNCRKDGHVWRTECVMCRKERPRDPYVRMLRAEYDAIVEWINSHGMIAEFNEIRDKAVR